MSDSEKIRTPSARWESYAWVLAVVWTVVVGASLICNVFYVRHSTLETARHHARGAFEKDLIWRRWVANRGGVYVPVSKETPPNPYLSHMEERDVTTPSGRRLTLSNPAHVTRRVHDLGHKQYSIRVHTTSLNPIRPENAADTWEREALESFERGITEVSSVEQRNGQRYMRLMRPLVTEEGCLKCHSAQEYKAGDIRGGVSISIPMEPMLAIARTHTIGLALGHALLWILGLSGTLLGANRPVRNERERKKATKEIAEPAKFPAENPVKDAGLVNVYGLNTTRRRQMERERKHDLHDLGKRAKELQCIYVYDLEKHTNVYINRQYTELTGWTLEDLRALEGDELFHPDELDAILAHRESVRQSGDDEIVEIEYRFNTKEGKWIWCLSRDTAFLRDARGQVKQLIGTFTDITTRKRAEQALHRAQDELIKTTRLAAIGQVSASIAHDLRNSLGAVRNASYVLRRRIPRDEPKVSELLKIIDQEVAKADQIITNLLEMAQPKEPHRQEVDLAKMVRELFDETKRKEGVCCRISLVPDPFEVRADPSQLRQLISNIVSNTVEAMRGQGEFIVEGIRGSDYDTLVFRDSGPGFTEEVIERVFEPLVTTKANGTGLGLTICRQIVEKHGGTIDAEDNEGGGAAIRIRLPRH